MAGMILRHGRDEGEARAREILMSDTLEKFGRSWLPRAVIPTYPEDIPVGSTP